MAARIDNERARLLEDAERLYAWIKPQVDGGYRRTEPLENEQANLTIERLVSPGLLNHWETINLRVVSSEMVEELATVIAHLKVFSIPEAVARIRRAKR